MRIAAWRLPFWVPAFLLLLPAVALSQPAAGQPAVALSDLVKPGDRLFVTEPGGVQTEGRLLRVSPDELVLLAGDVERVFEREGIGRIEKRDRLWNGMLAGAIPGAMIGASAAAFECSDCGRSVATGAIVVGVIGAGIGALVDANVKGYRPVFGPSLGSPNALRVPGPTALVENLWLRVRQGDTIDVVTLDGRKMRGRFVRVSESAVTLDVDGARQEILAGEVGRVTRPGNRFRQGALWGAVAFAALGAVGSAACHGRSSDCGAPPLVAIYVAMPGALWGTVIGALIPRHAVVYESGTPAELHLMPMLGAGRVGVVFSAKF
jgi:hypothetical protein